MRVLTWNLSAVSRRSEVVEVPSRFEISNALRAEVEPLIPARPRCRRYLLIKLNAAGKTDWSRAADSSHIRALLGGC